MIQTLSLHFRVMLVFTFVLNEPLLCPLSLAHSYLDSGSNMCQVVSILLDSIYIIYETELLFASSTDTSVYMQITRTTVVTLLNNIFILGQVE